jgi:hypothetical protein
MRKLATSQAVLLTVIAWSGTASAHPGVPLRKKPASLRVVEAYVSDFNHGDAAAAAAHFATDATFTTPLGGCTPCAGRDAIEQKLAGAIANKSHISISHPRVSGNLVKVKAALSSPLFPPGVHRAIGRFTATVRKGRIVSSSMTYDRSDPQTAALLTAAGVSAGTGPTPTT